MNAVAPLEGILDRPISVTFFRDQFAYEKDEFKVTLRDLADTIQSTSEPNKNELPWLKLARFGDVRSDKGSLRNDKNVTGISGVEIDYDGEAVPFEEACCAVRSAGIASLLYTSPSHTEAKPRWRILCPTSKEFPPTERKRFVARINGLFDGTLSNESFTLSQSYYFGSVNGNSAHRATLVDGTPIDLLDGLDATAIWPRRKAATNSGRGKDSYDGLAARVAALMRDEPALADLRRRVKMAMERDPILRKRWEGNQEGMGDQTGSGLAMALGRALHTRGFGVEEGAVLLLENPHTSDWAHKKGRALGWREVWRIWDRTEESPFSAVPLGPEALAAKDDPPILNPGAPLESARQLVRLKYLHGTTRGLHHLGGVFYRWAESHYIETANEEIQAEISRFLDAARRLVDGRPAAFNPMPKHVADVLAMLRTEVQLPGTDTPPAWLDKAAHPAAPEIISCQNGLLYLPDQTLIPHSPAFFNLNAVGYAFDRNARAPQFMSFLETIWPDDEDAIRTLQEVFGYLLTCDTRQQKMFMVVGPPRSGKGTIARVLNKVLGAANVAGPTLAGLSGNFGLSQLIGKSLAVITDARLGGRSDHVIAERLLAISGEDSLTIDRKYREPWTGKLPTRFLILTNELPRLADTSGALVSRFIIMRLTLSFLDKEDPGLTARLLQELPGILNWAIEGRLRLAARGHFVQPASSAHVVQALDDLASPIGAFLRDRCLTGAGNQVECDTLFSEWKLWCHEQGRDHPGTKQTFGRDLHAAVANLKVSRLRTSAGDRPRCYEGLTLAARASHGVAPLEYPRLLTGDQTRVS